MESWSTEHRSQVTENICTVMYVHTTDLDFVMFMMNITLNDGDEIRSLHDTPHDFLVQDVPPILLRKHTIIASVGDQA